MKMVRHVAALALFGFLTQTSIASNPPSFPSQTRLIIGIDCKQIAESPLVRKDFEFWRSIAADPRKGLAFLGIDPTKTERIWLSCGEDYPKDTLILIEGDFDATKLESKWQQQVRDRRHAATTQRVGERNCFTYELPANALAVPGLPTNVFVAVAGPKSVALGFGKESVTSRLSNEQSHDNQSNLVASLPKDASVGAVLSPPAILTSPQGLLAGIKQIVFTIRFNDNLGLSLEATPDNADGIKVIAEAARACIEQTRRVFPPLAKQQAIDPQMIRLISACVEAAQIETSDQRVVIRADLSGDEFRKAVGKP
jgi:hypothetical protein